VAEVPSISNFKWSYMSYLNRKPESVKGTEMQLFRGHKGDLMIDNRCNPKKVGVDCRKVMISQKMGFPPLH
jgi:hypothetical protein